MTGKQLIYNHTDIYYRVFGKGQPVVIIHGFGEDGEIWNDVVKMLEDNFLVIVPDLPGSGKSSLLENGDIDEYSLVINAILKNESIISPIIILGHSMGGYVSLAFAEKFTEKVKALGLLHSTAYADTVEKKLARTKSINFIRDNGSEIFLKTSIPGLFTARFNETYSSKVKNLIEHNKSISTEALIQYYEAMIKRPVRTEVLKQSAFPVLFVIGIHDQAVPYESSLQQLYLASVTHITILNETAHMGMMEEPTLFNEAIKNFILSL